MAGSVDGQELFSSLRDVLAGLYPSLSDARRVAEDADIDTARVAFDSRSINTWHNVLTEAIYQGRLDQLLVVVEKEYGEFPPLQEDLKQAQALLAEGKAIRLLPGREPDDPPLAAPELSRSDSARPAPVPPVSVPSASVQSASVQSASVQSAQRRTFPKPWLLIVPAVIALVVIAWLVYPDPSPPADETVLPTASGAGAQSVEETPTSAADTPAANTPVADTSTADTPAVNTSTADTSTADTPTANTPSADMPAALRTLHDRYGIEFVFVPAGDFTMGSTDAEIDAALAECDRVGNNPCERDWFSAEQPQHTLSLADYWIGKTEVTNAQFSAFVETGGYERQEFWTQAGWEWREANGAIQPGCWDDPLWNQPDHPVVCLSWYEAVAYAVWLAQESGLAVRLPTEAEWEKAARGTDGRIWPWGGEPPDATRANYCDEQCENEWKDTAADDRYRYTSPAGRFPAGASPTGALDMAGNVREWTGSLFAGYPYRGDDGREGLESGDCCRTVRGGSWYDHPAYVRTAVRFEYPPDSREGSLGFRLYAAP